MMRKARKNNSPLLQEILHSISPLEKEKIRVEMALSAFIGDTLKEMGMNKSAFAAKVGKQPSEVTKWLSGTHNFTVETLVEIATALEIKFEQLFVRELPSSPQPNPIVIHIPIVDPGKVPPSSGKQPMPFIWPQIIPFPQAVTMNFA